MNTLPTFPSNLSVDDEAHCRTVSWAHEACYDHGKLKPKAFVSLCNSIINMREICAVPRYDITLYIANMRDSKKGF